MKYSGEVIQFIAPTNSETRNCETHGEYTARFARERWSGCQECWEVEERAIRKAQDAKEEEFRIHNTVMLCDIPARYSQAELSMVEQREKLEAYLDSVKKGNTGGLLLFGQVGTGKTFAACALTREAAIRGIRSRYETVGRYIRRIKETWDSNASESSVFESVASARLLVLDEIGPGLANDKDAVRIHELIAERYDRALPTVYVTNLLPDGLKAAVKDRAYDRMRDGAIQINMTGESKRSPAPKN